MHVCSVCWPDPFPVLLANSGLENCHGKFCSDYPNMMGIRNAISMLGGGGVSMSHA